MEDIGLVFLLRVYGSRRSHYLLEGHSGSSEWAGYPHLLHSGQNQSQHRIRANRASEMIRNCIPSETEASRRAFPQRFRVLQFIDNHKLYVCCSF